MTMEELYDHFEEERRLCSDNASSIEYLTTMHYIHRYLKPGMRILEIGAASGRYSCALAQEGYSVCAVEPLKKHVQILEKKKTVCPSLHVIQTDACDLSMLEEESYDMVLVLGPCYHLHEPSKRKQAFQESKRVCKKDGRMFFAYIPNDMVILTEVFRTNGQFLNSPQYISELAKVDDEVFYTPTIEEIREEFIQQKLTVCHEIAADGCCELLQQALNEMDGTCFQKWMNFHFHICEKPYMLGASSHLLYIAKKSMT